MSGTEAQKENAILNIKPYFSLTEKGLEVTGGPTFTECQTAYRYLSKINESIEFAIGDLLNYVEQTYGEAYSQLVDGLDYEAKSIGNMMRVSKAVAPSRRRATLTWSHHEVVYSLPPDDQEEWLDVAEEENLNVHHFRNKIRQAKKKDEEQEECECVYVKYCPKCKEMIL